VPRPPVVGFLPGWLEAGDPTLRDILVPDGVVNTVVPPDGVVKRGDPIDVSTLIRDVIRFTGFSADSGFSIGTTCSVAVLSWLLVNMLLYAIALLAAES